MSGYERNKIKISEYRNRNKSKIVLVLCDMMEWFNEKCIKESEV